MAVPNYAAYVESLGRSPLAGALQSGIAGYQLIQENALKKAQEARAQQAAQLEQQTKQQQMAQIQQQMEQQKQLFPGQLQQGQNVLQQQQLTLKKSVDDSQMALMTKLAYMPEKYRKLAYESERPLYEKMGQSLPEYDETKFTPFYENIKRSSPFSIEQSKQLHEISKIELQNQNALKIAQINNAAKQSKIEDPYEKRFKEKSAEKDQDYISTVATDAKYAHLVMDDANDLLKISTNIPEQLGYVKEGQLYFTKEGLTPSTSTS